MVYFLGTGSMLDWDISANDVFEADDRQIKI